MATVNERLKDAAVRNQVFLTRYGTSTANRIVALLQAADRDLVGTIRDRMERIRQRGYDLGPATTKRLQSLLEAIRTQSADMHAALRDDLTADLISLAELETDIFARRLNEAVGVDLGNLRPAPEVLRSVVTSRPFQGRLLREWVADMDAAKARELKTTINLGIVEGQTTDDIIARVRAKNDMTYHRAGALVRTSINHVATRARDLLFSANDDVVEGVEWVSTLDSRTCLVAGTPVLMADGTTKTIDAIQPGETVVGGSRLSRRVMAATTATTRKIAVVTLSNGVVIRCTPDHLFHTADGEWTEAQSLIPGQNLADRL